MRAIEKLRQILKQQSASNSNVYVTNNRQTYEFDDDNAAWATISISFFPSSSRPVIVIEESPAPLGDERYSNHWLRFGAQEVWIVNDQERSIDVYTKDGRRRYTSAAVLATSFLPGFQCHVAELF